MGHPVWWRILKVNRFLPQSIQTQYMLDIWLHLKSGHLTADSYWQYSSGWQPNKYGRQEFSELLLPYSMCGSNEEGLVETEKQKRQFSFCSLRLTLYKWPLLNCVILVYICCAKFLVIYNPIKKVTSYQISKTHLSAYKGIH